MTVDIWQCTDDTKDRSVAFILHIMTKSANYRHWTVQDIQRNIFPAVRKNQCVLTTESGTPISFLTWTWFSSEVSDQLRIDGRTPPLKEWRQDGTLWFMDFASPQAPPKPIIAAIGELHFKNEVEAYSIRRNPDASIRKINLWKKRPPKDEKALASE